MKTAEELNALKNEVETLNKKLAELSEEELTQVSGGEYDYHQKSVLTICSCGAEITLNSEFRMNSGFMEIRCPNCGQWYRETTYNYWMPIG